MGVLQFAILLALADPDPAAEGVRLLEDAGDDRASYEGAIKAFEAALAAHPEQSGPLHAQIAHAELRLGDVQTDEATKLATYKKGQAAAEAGIAADPKCARCLLWKGANLGRWGQVRGIMQSLFLLGDVKGAFDKALAIDPGDFEVALALALVDAKVPGFAGGSSERAEAAMKKVIAAHPHFTRARLDLAEVVGGDQAKALIDGVLAETAPLFPGEYRKFDVKRAKALRASL